MGEPELFSILTSLTVPSRAMVKADRRPSLAASRQSLPADIFCSAASGDKAFRDNRRPGPAHCRRALARSLSPLSRPGADARRRQRGCRERHVFVQERAPALLARPARAVRRRRAVRAWRGTAGAAPGRGAAWAAGFPSRTCWRRRRFLGRLRGRRRLWQGFRPASASVAAFPARAGSAAEFPVVPVGAAAFPAGTGAGGLTGSGAGGDISGFAGSGAAAVPLPPHCRRQRRRPVHGAPG